MSMRSIARQAGRGELAGRPAAGARGRPPAEEAAAPLERQASREGTPAANTILFRRRLHSRYWRVARETLKTNQILRKTTNDDGKDEGEDGGLLRGAAAAAGVATGGKDEGVESPLSTEISWNICIK